jgi:hypothetical protein
MRALNSALLWVPIAIFACFVTKAKADILPPALAPSGAEHTFIIGGPAVVVDNGLTVTSADIDITGATEQIVNLHSGDALHFTNQFGIFGSYNSGLGMLSLSGSATPAQYQLALETVTFSTIGVAVGTRDISIQATDSAATPQSGNTLTEFVNVTTPEPASVVMMALGAIGLLGVRRLRARRTS